MPDYLEYQKSIAQEFKAYENRVRNLIDDANWAEEGRFKEIIDKTSNNGRIIDDSQVSHNIFNGIFSYNIEGNIDRYYQYIEKVQPGINSDICRTMVNNISLGSEYHLNFMNKSKYRQKADGYISYDVYEMNDRNKGLAFAYFFSYLLEIIYRRSTHFIGRLPREFVKLLFPIDEMARKIYNINIDIKEK